MFSSLAVTTCYKPLRDFLRIFIKKLFDILKTSKMFLKNHITAYNIYYSNIIINKMYENLNFYLTTIF